MSTRLTPNVVTPNDVQPAIVPTLALDGEDAWVALRLSEHNLREVVARLVVALKGHALTGDLVLIRATYPTTQRYEALSRVCSDDAVREALTFLLDQSGADTLADDLYTMDAKIRYLESCDFPDRDCWNKCLPGHTRCPIHEGS